MNPWFSLSFPRYVYCAIAGPEGAKNQRGKVLRLIQNPLRTSSLRKISLGCQDNSGKYELPLPAPETPSASRQRAQRNALSVVAVRVRNEDRLPVGIHS
jgi:hypothetical protein